MQIVPNFKLDKKYWYHFWWFYPSIGLLYLYVWFAVTYEEWKWGRKTK